VWGVSDAIFTHCKSALNSVQFEASSSQRARPSGQEYDMTKSRSAKNMAAAF
jgi:hypothetical protein